MRMDKNFILFTTKDEWYDFVEGIGYVPTEQTPPDAVEAIKRYDLLMFGTPADKITIKK